MARKKKALRLVAIPSPASLLNALAVRADFEATRNIPYWLGVRQRLDVYRPRSMRASGPVVIFFYGGGWERGDKADYLFVGAALASRGFIAVIPDYRIYPEVRYPAFIQDGALAVRWALDHSAEFNGDPNQLVLMGHSAGAYIASMLSFDRKWLDMVGLDPAHDLKGLVGLAGPYDFLPLRSSTLKSIFGDPARLAQTQPINFADGKGPPAFLVSGRSDRTVDPGNSRRLAERIRQNGGNATTKFYNYVGHTTVLGAFAAPLRPLAPVLRDAGDFVEMVVNASAK